MRQSFLFHRFIAGGGLHEFITWALVFTGFALVLASPGLRAEEAKKPYSTVSVIDSVLASDSSVQGKVVYVDFWASWCPPCRASFPWMNRLAKKYKSKGLEIVTVNLDKKHESAVKFIDEHHHTEDEVRFVLDLPVIFDSTASLAKMFEIDAMPTSFIYERSGKLYERHQGFNLPDTIGIEDKISELLSEEPKK